MENRYDTYILEICQSNGVSIKNDDFNIYRSARYDELRYKKLSGNQKVYLNYFRMNDIFSGNEQSKVSSQVLSLYQHAGGAKNATFSANDTDPFTDNADAPFLILVQIRLYKKIYSYIKNMCQKETKPDVETFLTMTEKSITRRVKRIFTSTELGSLTYKLFRSSTTGDFYLVIRTACASLIDKTMDKLQTCTILASIYMTAWKRKEARAKDIVYISIPEKTKLINKGSLALGKTDVEKYRRNQKLLDRIIHLDCYRMYFAPENRNFQDLFHATKELYWNYAAAAWEKDTEINWLIWYHDMEVLCGCIKAYMIAYQKMDSGQEKIRTKFRTSLLDSWRESILAIDRYMRLVHNVNIQNYHASSFESQTQIDAEKIMVAYREAMRVYYRGYDEESAKKYNAAIRVEPIIYPALMKDKIAVTTLFANIDNTIPYDTRVSVCTVPSFENFGRFYDFLPLLMHETAHAIRVMERPKRNRFLIHYTLKHVFLAMIKQLLQEPQDANRYEDMGTATEDLLKAFLNVAESNSGSDLEIITFAKKKHKIELAKNANFEQTTDILSLYLQEILPQETNVMNDFEKARDRLLEIFIEEFRQNGMLEDPYIAGRSELLADLQALKDGSQTVRSAEKLLESALAAINKKTEAMLPDELRSGIALLSVKDFYLPAKAFDQKIYAIRNALENPKTSSILNEYIFFVTKLYRVYKLYCTAETDNLDSEKESKEFLGKVFDEYREVNRCKKQYSPQDPETMYFLNYMGLLGTDKEIFYKQCKKAFAKMSFQSVLDCKQLRTRIYRETCADVMMAVSLHLTAFGYCRQIFRVIADTTQSNSYDRYNSLDFYRFRTVTGLLLLIDKKQIKKKEPYGEDEYKINGESLIEEGICYCEHYLKYIRQSISERETNVSMDRIYAVLGDMNEQIKILLREHNTYEQTLLYALLHEKSADLSDEISAYWIKNQDLKEILQKYNQHFWRLECFCKGLQNILPDGDIIVESEFLDHVLELWNNVKNPSSSCGCIWENNLWPCMLKSKEKVGSYYNDPESVFTVSDEEKLEDTIEFIQNFYFHNRIDMVRYAE